MQARRDALEKLLAPVRTCSTSTSPPAAPITPSIVLRGHEENLRAARHDSQQSLLEDGSHEEKPDPVVLPNVELPKVKWLGVKLPKADPLEEEPLKKTPVAEPPRTEKPVDNSLQGALQQDLFAATRTRTKKPEKPKPIEKSLVIKYTMSCLSCSHNFTSCNRKRFDTAVEHHRATCDKELTSEFWKRNPDYLVE